MPYSNKRSLGVILATITMLLIGGAPAAIADEHTPGNGYTAPAPSKLDASGTDQDQYCIPEADFGGGFNHPQSGYGAYKVGGKPQLEGCHSTRGASSVTVTTDFDSGTWTFDFSPDITGEEAKNTYAIEIGDRCKTAGTSSRYREVTAYFTNQPDATGRYVHSIYPRAVRDNGNLAYDTDVAYDIRDGDTATMRVKIFDDLPGLVPGTWKVAFWRSDDGSAAALEGYVVKRMRIVVPRCGGSAEPQQEARGKLKRLGCNRVKVVANARQLTSAPKATYSVVKHAGGRKLSVRRFDVPAGSLRAFKVKQPARFKVASVTLRLKQSNGRWVRLDRERRCR